MYKSDWRLVICHECGARHKFDVNSEGSKEALEWWDEYHGKCKERLREQYILRAMRMKNKSLVPYVYIAESEQRENSDI